MTIFDQAQEIAGATLATLGSLFLILILSLYMLADSERLLAKLNRVVPRQSPDELQILESSVARAFGASRAQLVLAIIQAILVAVVGGIFHIPYLFLVGTLSALAMIIPFFGPPLALIPPIVAAWIYTPDTWLISAGVLVAVQTVLGELAPAAPHAGGARDAPDPRPGRPAGRRPGCRRVGRHLRHSRHRRAERVPQPGALERAAERGAAGR